MNEGTQEREQANFARECTVYSFIWIILFLFCVFLIIYLVEFSLHKFDLKKRLNGFDSFLCMFCVHVYVCYCNLHGLPADSNHKGNFANFECLCERTIIKQFL